MTAPRATAKRSTVAGLAIASAVLLVATHLIHPEGDFGEVTYLGALIAAAGFALWGAIRRPPESRAAWCWIAFGVFFSAFGDVAWSLYFHTQHVEPDISVADIAWMVSYGSMAIGLFMMRADRRVDHRDIDGLIDLAVVAVVSVLVVWQVAVEATITDASLAPGVRVVWSSYPILDALLLALVVRSVFGQRGRSPGILLLAGGVGCWLFSDFFYVLYPSTTGWAGWLEAGWMLGALLLVAAIWQHPPVEQGPLAPGEDRVGAGRTALVLAPLLVPACIEVLAWAQGTDPNPVPMLAATVVLVGLAFARALRLLRRTEHVQAELRSTEELFRAARAALQRRGAGARARRQRPLRESASQGSPQLRPGGPGREARS